MNNLSAAIDRLDLNLATKKQLKLIEARMDHF